MSTGNALGVKCPCMQTSAPVPHCAPLSAKRADWAQTPNQGCIVQDACRARRVAARLRGMAAEAFAASVGSPASQPTASGTSLAQPLAMG